MILTLAAQLDSSLPVTVSYAAAPDTLQSVAGDDVASFEDAGVGDQLSLVASESESFEFASTIAMDHGAEISAFDSASGRLFVTSPENGLQVLGIDGELQMTKIGTIDLGSNEVNSVAVKNGIVAVAVANADKTLPGTVYFLDAGGTVGDASMILGSVEVGANPDMLTFTPGGTKVLVANEGEMASVANDPEGSVSIIDLSAGVEHATVATAGFGDFNSQLDALKEAGVRLLAGEAGFESTTVAQDLEPEYISISPDGKTAFVTLQENNAIGVLDIATATFTDIVPLGLKSFSSLPFDGSDKDGIDLETGQPLYGQYMPDAIASFTAADGESYFVIANEGDDRDDFLATPETARVKDLDLDSTVFPDAATFQTNGELGRLNVSNAPGNNGDTDGDGDIDQLLAYGARSFSILDSEGNIVFDSGSHIEQFVAESGLFTDANGAGLFDDGRSDNKGPEPEGITVSVVDGKTLAFVTLERGGGGVMVYDVTDPSEVSFVEYLRNPGDVSPEGVLAVSGADSPTGHDLLIVSNEVSNTVTIFQENDAPDAGRDIADTSVLEGGKLNSRVLSDAFTDADGDMLTYTATLVNGDPLPDWLHFDPSSHSVEAMEAYFLNQNNSAKWATDSASAITAMVTGQKTDAGNLSWETGDPAGGELTTIAETLRADYGFAIGVASTVEFSHATPAGVVSHDVNRGHTWDIAHEILTETQPEVVIGAGLDGYFATVIKDAKGYDRDLDNNGKNDEYDAFHTGSLTEYTENVEFVEREAGVDGGDALAVAAASVDLAAGERLFGLFGTTEGHFEYYDVADTPGAATITRSTGDGTPTVDEDPTMAEMVDSALSVLNQDTDGFFIMFEQGDIDWSNHANDYQSMIGGVYDLDLAVTEVENYVASGENGIDWSNTLVVVTSDHSNSYMRNESVLGVGDLGTVGTDVTYASGGHTNELVTVSARGAGATYFSDLAGQIYADTNIIDNTQIYTAMMNAAENAGAEHIILMIGDGMNIEHEIAASRYLYGEDFALSWDDWGTLSDGWMGYATTWDVTSYNNYADLNGVDHYDSENYDPVIGYDPAQGGETPYPVAMTFTGTPGSEDAGSIDIMVTATDATGASASQTFELTVGNLVSSAPPDGGEGVVVMQDMVMNFTDSLAGQDGVISLWKEAVGGTLVEQFDLGDSDQVTVAGNQLRIDPAELLDYDSHYVVTVEAGAANAEIGSIEFDTRAAHENEVEHDLGGSITFWKSGEALDEVLATVKPSGGESAIEFRDLQVEANGDHTVEIWKTVTGDSVDAVELHLTLQDGATASWSDAEGLPTEWFTMSNGASAGAFDLVGMEFDALSTGLSTEAVKLGTLTIHDAGSDGDFSLALTDGAIQFHGADAEAELALFGIATSTDDGLFEVRDLSEGDVNLGFTKSADSIGDAVQFSDALAALKLAIGMNPNADGSEVLPFQYLAADVNEDGRVTVSDAVSILKMAAGFESAPEQEWLFVPESVASETMSRTSVHWEDYFTDFPIAQDSELDLVGVIKGDVDGSWSAVAV